MAPNGGPSMASQARAAELNAAAAARARILNGPRSTPGQFSTSHTNNTEPVAVESFRRPNRPIDRYYPPVATTPTPVPMYTYPHQDPRAIPSVYASAPYPVATEYYQPVYQPMQSYQQMYPSYMSGYPPPASPLHRGAIAAMTRQSASRSATSPTKPDSSHSVQLPATPPAKPPRFPSPAKSLSKGPSRGPSRSPSKSPLKKFSATPSPKKPPVEVLRFFTPNDLSPPKIEVEIMRFKAAQAKIAKEEDKAKGDVEDKTNPEESLAKSVNEHEGNNGHHKSREPEVEGDEQVTPRAKQSGPSNVVRASNPKNQSTPRARRQPLTLEDSPLTQKAYRKSKAEMFRPFSLLPPGFMPGSDAKDNLSPASQQQTLRIEEVHSTKPDKSVYQDDGIFFVAQKIDEALEEIMPRAAPRRLQSPIQLRPHSPVAYYKPIVNKYPRNVFASWQSRLEELWRVETEQSWLAFQQKPLVKDLPGPFRGFPRFPLVDENAQRPMNTGVLMPPPGFAVPGPILMSRSVHWNPECDPSNRATTYYDRVLASEDWFHQSILKKTESSNKFQKKLSEVQSMILDRNDTSSNVPPSSKDIKAAQVTEITKRILENLISYTDTAENEQRGFVFGDIEFELDVETGHRRPRRKRRKARRSHRGRNRGCEFYIAPGYELFDGGVVGKLADSSDS